MLHHPPLQSHCADVASPVWIAPLPPLPLPAASGHLQPRCHLPQPSTLPHLGALWVVRMLPVRGNAGTQLSKVHLQAAHQAATPAAAAAPGAAACLACPGCARRRRRSAADDTATAADRRGVGSHAGEKRASGGGGSGRLVVEVWMLVWMVWVMRRPECARQPAGRNDTHVTVRPHVAQAARVASHRRRQPARAAAAAASGMLRQRQLSEVRRRRGA
eukprot:184926-Chlamydomonas_euryale.AAC.1